MRPVNVLVLAHSLWQFALLAVLATLLARVWKHATPEQIYVLMLPRSSW